MRTTVYGSYTLPVVTSKAILESVVFCSNFRGARERTCSTLAADITVPISNGRVDVAIQE